MVDPNIVYLVLLLGLWSGVTAVYVPGTGLVEMISGLISVAAVWLLAQSNANWAAVFVVVVGLGSFLIMPLLRQPRFGWLALGGLILQAVGSFFLFYDQAVSPALIALTVLMSFAFYHYILLPALHRHRDQPDVPIDYSDDKLLGARGRVVQAMPTALAFGSVRAEGETWTARSDQPLDAGDEVVVVDREGLVLVVEGIKHKRTSET